MPMKYAHLAQEVFNTPLLIAPSKLETIATLVRDRMCGAEPSMETYDDDERRHAGYEVIDGIALINVFGTLVHRADWLDAASGLTGYNFLQEALAQALDDDGVEKICLIVHSPGGQVAGAFDFADKIYQSRSIKPSVAIASDMALSAGYLIASAATEVVGTRTSYTGSIGVVMAHIDQSKFDKDLGVDITYLFSGNHKVDGNPHQPLPDSVKGKFQSDLDAIRDLFTSTVARNRGVSEKDIRDTEAQIYLGRNALEVGLVDRISSEDAELARLFESTRDAGSRQSSGTFFRPPIGDGGEPAANSQRGKEDMSTAKTDVPDNSDREPAAAVTQAKNDGTKEGAQKERERINAILNSPEAEGRTELAKKLAFTTDMSPEAAADILKVAAKEDKGNAFMQAMEGLDNPQVGLSGTESSDRKVIDSGWDKAFKINGVGGKA